jgi:hypothetical protein
VTREIRTEDMVKATRIGDWQLTDRIQTDPRPIVVLFVDTSTDRDTRARVEFKELAQVYPAALFFEIDLLENPSLIQAFGLSRWPVTLVFVGGLEVARHIGSELMASVARVLGNPPEDDTTDDDA